MKKLLKVTLFILISCKLTFAQNPSAKTNHDKVDLLVEKYYESFEAAGLAVGIGYGRQRKNNWGIYITDQNGQNPVRISQATNVDYADPS